MGTTNNRKTPVWHPAADSGPEYKMLNARSDSGILKLVKEVQSDKLNISTQWLRGDYGPCFKVIQFITVLSSRLPSKESYCSQ